MNALGLFGELGTGIRGSEEVVDVRDGEVAYGQETVGTGCRISVGRGEYVYLLLVGLEDDLSSICDAKHVGNTC